MNNKLKKGLMLTVLCLGMSSTAVKADLVFDTFRTVKFAMQGVQRLMSLAPQYAKVSSKEKELKNWEGKKEIKKQVQPAMSEYLQKLENTEMKSKTLVPPQKDVVAADNFIREKFYLPEDLKNVTDEKKREIEKNRAEYVEELAKEVLSLSEGIRENVAAEQSALKEAETATGGMIQQVDLMTQTKKTLAEQKLADVILQAKLLELEAAEVMMGSSVQLIEDPSKKTNANQQGG